MKASNLHDLWASPDNSRLASKPFSFRLPVHIAAKLAALGDMYPQKNRTQIVADLLTSALDELERGLPAALGDQLIDDETGEPATVQFQGMPRESLHSLGGRRGRFRDLANEHFEAFERELGNENPQPLFPEIQVTESSLKKLA